MNLKDFNLQELIDINYATDDRVSRRKGSGGTQEFFTPYSIVKKMCDKVPEEDWSNPDKTFLEPGFGNGNFVLAIIYYRLLNGIDWKTTLENLYGVELMEDNVRETKNRVHEMLGTMCDDYNKEVAENIMKTNLVCSDFFTWNFEEWRPYTSDELKKLKKK